MWGLDQVCKRVTSNSNENVDKYVNKCSNLWKSQENQVVTKDKEEKYVVGKRL